MIKHSAEKKINKLLAKCSLCDHARAACGVTVYRCAGPHRRMTDDKLLMRVTTGKGILKEKRGKKKQ